MTVRELVELLQSLPQDLPVYVADWNEERAPDAPLTGNIGEAQIPRVAMPKEIKRLGEFLFSLPERVVIG